MSVRITLVLLTFTALTTGCGPASAAGPDPSVVQASLEKVIGPVTFFKKLNGESRELMGQKIYIFHWVAASPIFAKNIFAWFDPNGSNITIGTPESHNRQHPLAQRDPTCKPEDKKNWECPVTLTDASEGSWMRFYMYPGRSVYLVRGTMALKWTENGWRPAPEATIEGSALRVDRMGFCRTPPGTDPVVTGSACYETHVAKSPKVWQ